jgi:hypothetical protein
MKKEQTAKRIAKARRPVQREPKEVLAELVEKLRGKLEVKATTSASQPEAGPRGELSPNLNRQTVGIDLGDQRPNYPRATQRIDLEWLWHILRFLAYPHAGLKRSFLETWELV